MMWEESTYEQIDRYLAGNLVGEELNAFQHRLANNEALAELLHYQELVNTFVKGQHLAHVKQMMDTDFEQGRVNPDKNTKWWWFGALLATGVLISVGLYNHHTNDIHQEIILDEPQTIVLTLPEKPQKTKVESVVEPLKKEKKTSVKVDFGVVEKQVLVKQISDEHPVDVSDALKNDSKHTALKEKPETTQSKSEAKCAINAKALVYAQPSCADESTGEINIKLQHIENAVKPYRFKVEDAYGKVVVQQNESFTSLMAEYYNVTLIDANNCTQDLARDVFVDTKECKKQETASFNPNYGEVFELPIPKEDGATIVIYSKQGKEVFQAILSKENTEVWDGRNMDGVQLSSGVYIYKIIYENGADEIGEVLIY